MIDLCAIRKIQNAIRELEDELKTKCALSLVEAMCLCALTQDKNEPSMLATELGLSPSRLTRILDSLEKQKLITRETSAASRRNVIVTPTQAGTDIIREYHCADVHMPEALSRILN